MGLDMYLTKSYCVKNWEHMTPEELHTVSVLKGGKPTSIPVEKICTIETEVIEWRKANAIHNWFVKNVQDGVDDCRKAYVANEQLKDLLNILNRIIGDPALAPELLPVQEGYYFGTYTYDDWYFSDIEETAEVLKAELAGKENGARYHYQSSW